MSKSCINNEINFLANLLTQSSQIAQINSTGEDSRLAIGGLQYLLQCISQSLATLAFTLRVDDAPTWTKSELIDELKEALIKFAANTRLSKLIHLLRVQ
jgi:hypothetical protein